VLPHQGVHLIDEPALIGAGGRFAVAHVDQLTAQILDHGQGALQCDAGFHAVQMGVADLDRNDLHPRGDTVALRSIGVMGSDDACDVGAVCAGWHHDGQQISVIVNMHAEMDQGVGSECGISLMQRVIFQQGFLTQVTVFVRIDDHLPD